MSSPSSATNDPRMEHEAVGAVAPSLTERQIMTNKNLADIAEEMAGDRHRHSLDARRKRRNRQSPYE
jgi:hypothetical protein